MTETNQELDITKTLLYWLPVTSLLLLIYGVLKITLFYSLFGVNILLFVDVGEIIPLILRDFAISIFGATVGFGIGFLYPNIRRQEISAENLKLSASEKKTTSRLYFYYKSYPLIILFVVGLLATLTFPIFDRNFDIVNFGRLIFLFGLPIICLVIPLEIIHLLKLNRHISLNANSKIFIVFFCILTCWGIYSSTMDYLIIRHHHSTKNTFIEIDGKTVISDDNHYFIGRTKSSIFFFNEKHEDVDVYNTAKVSKLNLK